MEGGKREGGREGGREGAHITYLYIVSTGVMC